MRRRARGCVAVRAVGYTLGDRTLADRRLLREQCYSWDTMEARESLSELIFLVEEAPEGGLTARALGTSIFTEAEDVSSLHDRVRDAVRCHFEEGQLPKVIRLHFVREEIITA